MIVIGITGGIGSGKSRVCDYIGSKYNACVIKADDVGHEVMEPAGRCYEALCGIFGDEYFLEDKKTFDRKKIGTRAFKEPDLLVRMNSVIHPAVKEEIVERLQKAGKAGCEIGVIEAALLIEADYRSLCREYWYVYVDKNIRIERLLASRDITSEKALDIMSRQKSDAEFERYCEYTVVNNGDFAGTEKQVDDRIAFLRKDE